VDGLSDILLATSILTSVLLGAGLISMGLCVLGRDVVNGVGKLWIARRIAPHVHARPRWTDWSMFREIFGFSAKTLVDGLAKVLQYQTGVMVIAAVLGPAAVAVYSRSRALILISTRFVMGFARVLVPTASALHEQGDRERLGHLLIRATKVCVYLSLLPGLTLLILGEQILHLWMGERYDNPVVLTILVLGYLPLFAQQGTYHILLGLASHGLAGLASLVGALVGAALTFLFVYGFHWGITGAAVATAVPVAVVNLLILPYAGCRAVGIPLRQYAVRCLVAPVAISLPFAGTLLASRIYVAGPAWRPLVVGLGIGVPVVAITLWLLALSAGLKRQVQTRLFGARAAPAVPSEL
jgi:O-antigen/teichoic acid export membrane protein